MFVLESLSFFLIIFNSNVSGVMALVSPHVRIALLRVSSCIPVTHYEQVLVQHLV